MEKKNAVYTIMEEQSPEEARREHILLIARNFAAGAAAVLFLASFALADIHKLHDLEEILTAFKIFFHHFAPAFGYRT
mgnify:CR=1 FL=1